MSTLEINGLYTFMAAFLAGAVTSVHCSAMCGPLSCAILCSDTDDGKGKFFLIGMYQVMRMVSYVVIGGFLGSVGTVAEIMFSSRVTQFLPWGFVIIFVIFGLGFERFIPQMNFFSRLGMRLGLNRIKTEHASWFLGLLTPFLPCGPLYLVFGVAVLSGSLVSGACLMWAFFMGTLPLYLLFQWQYVKLQRRFSPNIFRWLRQGLALVAAVLIVWRMMVNQGSGLSNTECLLCR